MFDYEKKVFETDKWHWYDPIVLMVLTVVVVTGIKCLKAKQWIIEKFRREV